ncbi:hypothetical protein NFI96_027999, partial [Prochilodus magdalenae]
MLPGKLNELKIWTLTQRRLMDCNLLFFTETWLNSNVVNRVVELECRALFRGDRSAAATGKTRGGRNCIYVNKAWCTDSVVMVTHCSADLEFLIIKYRPFYLPWEFNCLYAGIVYVPPNANANAAMEELCAAISKLQTDQPNGAFIVAGDFNHSDLRSGLPKFFQNVPCTTRGHRTLDKVYTNVANAYKATPLPHLGQSDHLSLFLLPKYTPVIRRATPATSLNTGVPQGCVLSPILYSLFTHDCVPIYGSNTIIKYADDTTMIGLIRDNDETAYRDEIQHLSTWCHDNNLTLNTQKTKEIIMDLRRSRSQAHPPVYSGAAVEQVTSFKFLCTHISSDLTWSLNSSAAPLLPSEPQESSPVSQDPGELLPLYGAGAGSKGFKGLVTTVSFVLVDPYHSALLLIRLYLGSR